MFLTYRCGYRHWNDDVYYINCYLNMLTTNAFVKYMYRFSKIYFTIRIPNSFCLKYIYCFLTWEMYVICHVNHNNSFNFFGKAIKLWKWMYLPTWTKHWHSLILGRTQGTSFVCLDQILIYYFALLAISQSPNTQQTNNTPEVDICMPW